MRHLIFYVFLFMSCSVFAQEVGYVKNIQNANMKVYSLKSKIAQSSMTDEQKRLYKNDLSYFLTEFNALVKNNEVLSNDGQNDEFQRSLVKELSNYSDLLNQANNSGNEDLQISTIEFLKTDVLLKQNNTSNLKEGHIKPVLIRVRVLNKVTGLELPGYEVFAKPQNSLNPDHIIAFNPTNNASKKLIPGVKVFWIKYDNVKVKERIEQISSISDKVDIDFIVP